MRYVDDIRGDFRVLVKGVRDGERSEPKYFGTHLYIIFSRYKLAFFTKTLNIFTSILFKRALIQQIIFKVSLV